VLRAVHFVRLGSSGSGLDRGEHGLTVQVTTDNPKVLESSVLRGDHIVALVTLRVNPHFFTFQVQATKAVTLASGTRPISIGDQEQTVMTRWFNGICPTKSWVICLAFF
jgi:hypothetical protein